MSVRKVGWDWGYYPVELANRIANSFESTFRDSKNPQGQHPARVEIAAGSDLQQGISARQKFKQEGPRSPSALARIKSEEAGWVPEQHIAACRG